MCLRPKLNKAGSFGQVLCSLRAMYGTDGTQNATHGSDSPTSALREIKFYFPGLVLEPLLPADMAKDYITQVSTGRLPQWLPQMVKGAHLLKPNLDVALPCCCTLSASLGCCHALCMPCIPALPRMHPCPAAKFLGGAELAGCVCAKNGSTCIQVGQQAQRRMWPCLATLAPPCLLRPAATPAHTMCMMHSPCPPLPSSAVPHSNSSLP